MADQMHQGYSSLGAAEFSRDFGVAGSANQFVLLCRPGPEAQSTNDSFCRATPWPNWPTSG